MINDYVVYILLCLYSTPYLLSRLLYIMIIEHTLKINFKAVPNKLDLPYLKPQYPFLKLSDGYITH